MSLAGYSVNGHAFKILQRLDEATMIKTINNIFQSYFTLISKNACDPEAKVPEDNLTLESLDPYTFELQLPDRLITIELDKPSNVKRVGDSKDLDVSLSVTPFGVDIQKELDLIEQFKCPKVRRGKLSDYYEFLCELRNLEPKLKYPRGKESEYLDLIRAVGAQKILVVVPPLSSSPASNES